MKLRRAARASRAERLELTTFSTRQTDDHPGRRIPTHQVNALIMGPAGYGVPDFMRAGGIMTVLFLVVMLSMMNLVF